MLLGPPRKNCQNSSQCLRLALAKAMSRSPCCCCGVCGPGLAGAADAEALDEVSTACCVTLALTLVHSASAELPTAVSHDSQEVIRNIANKAQTMTGMAIWKRRASRLRFGNAMIASETREGASPALQPTPGAQADETGATGSGRFEPPLRPPPSPATS